MAERETILKLKADTTGVEQGLNNVEESLKGVNKEVDELAKAGKTDPFAKKLEEIDKRVKSGGLSMRELTKEIKNYETIAIQAGRTSPVGQQALASAASLQDELGDLRNEIKNLSHDGANMQAALQLGGGVVAGYTAFQSATVLLGKENEDLQKTFVKLQAAQSALMAIEQLRASLEKESFLMIKAKALQTNILSAATAAYTAVVGTTTGAVKLFRLALVSTGIGAIIVGIGLLIANFDAVQIAVKKVVKWFASMGEQVARLIEWYNEMGIAAKIALYILAAPIFLLIEAYQLLFGEVEKGTAEQMKRDRERSEMLEREGKKITDAYNKEVARIKEKRRLEKEAFDEKQVEFDLNIARAEAEGKNTDALNIKKLEAILIEKKAVLQHNQDLINAMIDRYTLEAQLRGKSLDDFLLSIGINKAATEQLLKDQLLAQEQAVFQADTELMAFKHNISKKSAALSAEARKKEEEENKKLYDKMKADAQAAYDIQVKLADQLFARRVSARDKLAQLQNEASNDEMAQLEYAHQLRIETLDETIPEEYALKLYYEELYLQEQAALREKWRLEDEEAEKKTAEEKKAANVAIAEQTMELALAINDFANQIADNKIAKIQRDAKKELSTKGLTEQQKYNIELKAAKAVDDINRKKFQRDKAFRIANAVMDGAGATIKALASAPPPANFILAGLVGASAAVNIATISAQKFEGSAASLTPPDFSSASSSESGSGSDTGNNQQTGGQQTNVTTATENLINGGSTKVVLSMVELNKMQNEMNQIDAVSTIGGG